MERGDLVEAERPVGVEPEGDAGALQEDRVGGDVDVGGTQRTFVDPGRDQAAEDRLVVVALGDQLAARLVGERADLAVGHECLAGVQPVVDDVFADRGGELHRRLLLLVHRGGDAGGELLHEVVLKVDQDRLLARVPVVDRRRLHVGGGGEGAHRGRVVAELREQVDRGAVDRLPSLGPAADDDLAADVGLGGQSPSSSRVCSWVATSRPSVPARPTAISTRAAFEGAWTPRLM